MAERLSPERRKIGQQVSIMNTQARGRIASFKRGKVWWKKPWRVRKHHVPDPPITAPHQVLTVEDWMALCEKYDNKCLRCHKKGVLLVIDHIIPISSGGLHHINNMQPLCRRCNGHKGLRVIDYRPDLSSAMRSIIVMKMIRPDGEPIWEKEYDAILSPSLYEILSRGKESKEVW